ncbi:MAG: glycosyltransferase family 1 protein [Syntrophomonadaceae bacterium]|nr:glycosyltransferase family 1 protein [Syntrophomonadaceae bacterium]
MAHINCILYPPTLEYHYLVQRPQHLMRSFSELGIPAFFLNNSSTYSKDKPGIRKLNDFFYLLNQVDPVPYLGSCKPIVYYTAAAHVDMVKKYNPELVIFDSVDEPSEEFEAWRPNYYRAVSSADLVLTASDKLYQMASELNSRVYLLPNACDYDYFSSSSSRDYEEADSDIDSIQKPIIGYIGVVASWCDLELITAVADRFPQCNLVIIGPLYNISQVPKRPNIHWLGFKPYEKLAAYARSFDVGIIPFKNTSMTESVNPIKMWEYMAVGLPVVATALPEARKHGDLVLYSENQEQFLNNIKRALYQDTPEKKQQRQQVAKENSWMQRAQTVLEIIKQEMQRRELKPDPNPVFIEDEAISNSNWRGLNSPSNTFSYHYSLSGSRVKVAKRVSIAIPNRRLVFGDKSRHGHGLWSISATNRRGYSRPSRRGDSNYKSSRLNWVDIWAPGQYKKLMVKKSVKL